MKKIFILICGVVIATQCSLVSAQTTQMKMWKDGKVAITYTDVDSVAFETSAEDEKQDLGGGVYLINGHKFVDLGLPSGLLWAETNVGAETAAGDGKYYAWGETTPKTEYNEGSYFDSDYANYPTSGKTTLEKQHDAAYVNWGSSCRMPTNDEFGELLDSNNCIWEWVSMATTDGSSINGYKVTSTKNGNSIFLPPSGIRGNGDLDGHGSCGYYWSSTHYPYNSYDAYFLYFNSSYHGQHCNRRYYGYTVRPVAEP